jgi:hypothetical protein
MKPSEIQRRAPLTITPTPGISTAISSSSEPTNSHGATFSQVATDTWNASRATTKADTSDSAWRVRK